MGDIILFEEPTRIYYPKTSYIWVATTNNVISDISIRTNFQANNKPNTLLYSIDKGLYFKTGRTNSLYGTDTRLDYLHKLQGSNTRGYSINSASSFNSDEPFYFRLATETSSTTYHDIKTISALGNYDIISTNSNIVDGNKTLLIAPISPFVLGRVDKNSSDTRYTNSQGLYFLNTQSLSDGGLVNYIDSKTHTSENSKKAISINKNENNIFGSPMYKYVDLTKESNINYEKLIAYGTNSYTGSTNDLINTQYSDIRGKGLNYATSYKFKEGIISNTKVTYVPFAEYSAILSNTLKSSLSDGTQTMLLTPPETRGYLSVLGSNFADFTYYDSSKYTTFPYKSGLEYTNTMSSVQKNRDDAGARTTYTKIGKQTGPYAIFNRFYNDTNANPNKDIGTVGAKKVYEVFDPKCLSYHLFGPCDIFNDSFNNINNIAYSGHSYNFSDFGLIGQKEAVKIGISIEHETYTGGALSIERETKHFNSSSIISSSITPSQMKRFSLGRLIELTFDFHFNMFDSENITETKLNMGSDDYTQYYYKNRMVEKTPIKLTSAVAVGDSLIYVSRADWFQPYIAFDTVATRLGQIDTIFNSDGNHIGFIESTHQDSCLTGDVLSITTNSSDATNGTYTGIATTSSVAGTGLTVTVVVSGNAVTSVTVVATGNHYASGNTITISSSLIGGSTNVICTLASSNVKTYIKLHALPSGGNDIFMGYSSVVNQGYWIDASAEEFNSTGSNIICNTDTFIYAFRLQSDGDDDNAKDTQLYPISQSFEIGHFDSSWFPLTGTWSRNPIERMHDNRFMMLDFNTENKRVVPPLIQSVNWTASYHKQLFNERGSHWGDTGGTFQIADFNPFGPKRTLYEDGDAIGDDGHLTRFSFPNTNQDQDHPKIHLPFGFASHPMFNATYGRGQAMDLENGRMLTPFHDTYYYKKDNALTADYISEISGEFIACNNEASGGNVAVGATTITVAAHAPYTVGNKIYWFEDPSTKNKPVYIGLISSINTGTNVLTVSATTIAIPSGSAISTIRGHIMTYWHPSRLFQYMQGSIADIVKYGLGNKSGSSFINEGGLYGCGNFVLLKKQGVGNWDANPANAGTSFSMKYNLENYNYVGFNGSGSTLYDYSTAVTYSTQGAYWQSDVFTISMYNVDGDETDNDIGFGMPIFSTSSAFTPHLYTPELSQYNGLSGPEDMNVSGLWAFKPQMVLMTSTNTTVSSAGADFSSTDDFNRIDNADIRKITIDFSTAGLMNGWINFSPNLTGYFLVSNISTGEDAPSINNMKNDVVSNILSIGGLSGTNYFVPTYIHQILKHEVTYASTGQMIHSIWIDNATAIDSTLVGYRVMKWAENCTYEYSPEDIPLYALSNKTTKQPTEKKMYSEINRMQIGSGRAEEEYQGFFTNKIEVMKGNLTNGISKGTSGTNEGVLSMYVLLDAESDSSNYSVVRNITDIIGSTKKLTLDVNEPFYINDGTTKESIIITPIAKDDIGVTVLSHNKMYATKGVVSYGQPFTINVPSYYDSSALETLKIGSTYTMGNTVENIINDLFESNNITYTKPTIIDPYYIAPKIHGLDLYNSLVFVGNYQNLEPIVINKSITMRDRTESDTETNITITEGVSRVSLSDKRETMFDIFNKVIVYGDGVRSIRRNESSIKELGLRELEEVDTNLRTQEEVDDRASQLLILHTSSNIQIDLQIDKEGLEYIEVGDLITIDYPTEVPVGKYMILQIHHEIGRLATYSVGKYTAGLDYKIAEIINANRKVSSTIRGKTFTEVVEISEIIKDINIRELEIEISSFTIGTGQNLGFSTQIGFNTPIGFIGNESNRESIYREDLA